ncbi:MAG: tryptophan synthase subunit alpha [Verrucomicrobiota bacterium]
MPTRIDSTFDQLKKRGQKAFVAYLCGGDPDHATSVSAIDALVEAGTDILEIGVPFSDPLADGVVNQMAAQRALDGGMSLLGIYDLVAAVRAKHPDLAIVLFTYLNPVYHQGFEIFHQRAHEAGADGVLFLDLPPDEESLNQEFASAQLLQEIRLIAPTTPDERVAAIASQAKGFVYYVSREGVTGAQTSLAEGVEERVASVCAASPVPVVVGFGISSPEQARTVARVADGVVVGSAIVKVIEEFGRSPELSQRLIDFVKPLVDAVKGR